MLLSSVKHGLGVIAAGLFAVSAFAADMPGGMSGGTEADYQEMQDRLTEVIDAYNEGDVDGLMAAYTEDAWHVSMRRPMATSRTEIGTFFGPNMTNYEFTTAIEPLDLEVHGDIAYLIGRSALTGTPRDGADAEPFVEERIFTSVFKKVDGAWLIHRYMESTSPRPGEAPPPPVQPVE